MLPEAVRKDCEFRFQRALMYEIQVCWASWRENVVELGKKLRMFRNIVWSRRMRKERCEVGTREMDVEGGCVRFRKDSIDGCLMF